MSFKDVRDLSEHLKQLDYPHQFSISSLYTPYGSVTSFHEVSSILQWLAGRLEPGTILPGGTDTENDRILLIRSAAEFFVTKSNIKLNPRRLYASSSATATELLKITNLLMNATPIGGGGGGSSGRGSGSTGNKGDGKLSTGNNGVKVPNLDDDDDDDSGFSLTNNMAVDLGDKIDELRQARELSTELTNIGATLYDLLAKELTNKEIRNLQASRPLELVNVEKYLKNSIKSLTQKLQLTKTQLDSFKTERNTISAKLERKTGELERVKQRLEALQKIRPAFLEEFERLEGELKILFDQYFIRIRCLDALRDQVASRIKLSSKVHMTMSMGEKSSAETSMPFLPEGIIDSGDEGMGYNDDDYDDDEIGYDRGGGGGGGGVGGNGGGKDRIGGRDTRRRDRGIITGAGGDAIEIGGEPRASTRLRVRTAAINRNDQRFIGNMMGSSDLDSSLDSADDSDSDLDLVDEDLHSDDDETIAKLTGDVINKQKAMNSDEDF